MTTKKKTTKESIFKGNEVMIMLEQMSDGISIVAESQQDLTKRFDNFKDEIGKLRQETNEKFEQVFVYLSRIEDEVVGLRKDLEKLKETKADKKDLDDFNERLEIVEKQMAKMQRQIA